MDELAETKDLKIHIGLSEDEFMNILYTYNNHKREGKKCQNKCIPCMIFWLLKATRQKYRIKRPYWEVKQ